MSRLAEVTKIVLARLPGDVQLDERVYIERYPIRRWAPETTTVFAYQFFSTEGRNVATWIPDMGDLPNMHTDSPLSSQGRLWGVPMPPESVPISGYMRRDCPAS